MADLYPDVTSPFPHDLKAILTQHHAILLPELLEKVVGSLVLLRRKEVINSTELLTTLFSVLVASPRKSLRAIAYTKIVNDLRGSNVKTTNHRLNKVIISVLRNLITSDRSSPKGIWAVKITRELWRRQVSGWTDAKPVDVMKEACLADDEKTASTLPAPGMSGLAHALTLLLIQWAVFVSSSAATRIGRNSRMTVAMKRLST